MISTNERTKRDRTNRKFILQYCADCIHTYWILLYTFPVPPALDFEVSIHFRVTLGLVPTASKYGQKLTTFFFSKLTNRIHRYGRGFGISSSPNTPLTLGENRSDDESASSKLRGGMTLMPTKKWQSSPLPVRAMPPRNLELADSSSDQFSPNVRGV